jgi:hypothetical protein
MQKHRKRPTFWTFLVSSMLAGPKNHAYIGSRNQFFLLIVLRDIAGDPGGADSG